MISERLLTLARCPDCGGGLAGATGDAAGVRRLRPDVRRPGRATSTCGRRPRSTSRRSTSTRRCTPTRGTSACRRRCWPPASATTCCARSCGRGPTTGSSTSAAAAGGRWSGTATRGALPGRRRRQPVLRARGAVGREPRARRPPALPFADGAFTKGYALDVFEHLSREALAGVLREASRVLAPGGRLFVYSHVRKNSRAGARPARSSTGSPGCSTARARST